MRKSTAPGSSPANGSSSTSTSGSCTSAAASCTRWAIPPDRSLTTSPPLSGEIEPFEECRGADRCGSTVDAVQPRQPDQLIVDAHVEIQPALLRHVSPRSSVGVRGRAATPIHLAGVRFDDAEENAHQCRLPCTIGTQEPHDPTGRHDQVDRVEHSSLAERMADAVEGQHVGHRFSLPHRRDRQPSRRVPGPTPGVTATSSSWPRRAAP